METGPSLVSKVNYILVSEHVYPLGYNVSITSALGCPLFGDSDQFHAELKGVKLW